MGSFVFGKKIQSATILLQYTSMTHDDFQKTVWDFYTANKRSLPWRPEKALVNPAHTLSPQWQYKILVSEIMLQQTQVDRVIPLYTKWLKQFPTFTALAHAPQKEVLLAWQGLGYNRRALNLKRCAEKIVSDHKGRLPNDPTLLQQLPGIGPYTAGALMAFVFNSPLPLIETNVRTVYFHHFFKNKKIVSDAELLKKVTATLDEKNPREWYYALMDYGSYLKRAGFGYNAKSKHYTKQSKFKGSSRELRAHILRDVLAHHPTTLPAITKRLAHLGHTKEMTQKIAADLVKEKMLRKGGRFLDVN